MADERPDCLSCGVCCFNPARNRAEGFVDYVAIDDPRSRLLTDAGMRRRYVRSDGDGRPHLKLLPDHRCVALLGTKGRHVMCSIYAHRPKQCRKVQPGDAECLAARHEHGFL
jgi:uncharacterized protein